MTVATQTVEKNKNNFICIKQNMFDTEFWASNHFYGNKCLMSLGGG